MHSFGATISVSSIVINPLDPAIMYVGTGEGFYNYDAIRGAGVYKTTNGGSSWYQSSSASPASSGDWSYVNRLTMHPTNPAILFAATGGGIYRTTDSGVTWTSQAGTRVLDVKIDATNPLRVVAGRADGRESAASMAARRHQRVCARDSSTADGHRIGTR